jgi:elongation factor P
VRGDGDKYVFMDNESFEQYEIAPEQMDDAWKFLKEAMICQVTLFNNNPIVVAPPNHVVLLVEYAEPAVRGNTATNLTKPVKVETGAEFLVPAFVEQGEMIRIDTRTGEYVERVRE